jgi:single-stranded DNA-binding protein
MIEQATLIYTDRRTSPPPVFHRVVTFGPMAENICNSVHKGTGVVVVGQLLDDSYETGRGETKRQVVLEAQVVAVSLKFATVSVRKINERKQAEPETVERHLHSVE